MAAEIMFGVFFNLSFWYKLTDRTIWGTWFSVIGCIILIIIDVMLIPRFGYMACAWAGFAAYGTSMVISYFVGQRYYPIAYPLNEMAAYAALAAVLFAGISASNACMTTPAAIAANTLLIAVFAAVIVKRDFPLGSLPVIGKYFRRRQ